MNTCQKYLIAIVVAMLLLLFGCWMFGYFYNGFKTGFDLASCWGGLAALGSAGLLALFKFLIDSVSNSKQGEHPYEQRAPDNERGLL